MSFANYLVKTDLQQTFTIPVIDILQEPTTLDEGARISDTIAYIGNATYPVNATSVISSSPTFQPAFKTGFNEADYLRVRVDRTTNNFSQLMNVDYLVSVNSNSKTKFDVRFALYDTSLSLIQAYPAITYDPSNISAQPNLLSQFELQGWSIEIPNQAEYGFLELSGAGITSLGFQYANTQVVNAIDNSDPSGSPPPTRSSKNLFYVNWGAPSTDASGVLVDLAILQAEVAQLKIDVSQADLDISDLSGRLVALDAEKLDASGGVVFGSLIRSNTLANLPSGWEQPFAKSQSDGAYLVYEGGDANNSYNPAIGVYGSSTFPSGVGTREVLVWAGSKSGNQRTSAWETATMTIDDNLTMGGLIQMAGNRITDLSAPINPNDATTKTYVDTCGASLTAQINQRLPLGGGTMGGAINMNTQKITNLGTPTASTDASTKGYVDSQTAGFLPIVGGTLQGQLNMNSNAIVNLPAPVSAGDATNKSYVDSHTSGNYLPLAGGSMTGAISMGNNQITNLATPSNTGDATTKGYVDSNVANRLALSGGALTGALTSNSNISTTGNMSCNQLSYTSLNPPLPPTSGISAVLTAGNNAGGQLITNLGSPVNPSDVANKAYADTKLSLTGGALTGALTTNSTITSNSNIQAPTFTATSNITTPVLNYTTLNPAIPTPNLGAVLTAGNNAGGNSITNVGNVQLSTLSSPTSNIQINQADFLWPLGGIYIGQDAGANTTALCSFYQYNKATDFVYTAGQTGLLYDMTPPPNPGSDITYVLKRGFTSLFVNRQPNTASPANNFITLPDPDATWVGTKIELLISGTGNANNFLTIGVLTDIDGLMLIHPWINWFDKNASNQQSLTYPSYYVFSGGETDWYSGTGGTTPVGGLLGLSWWNQNNVYTGSLADSTLLNAISGGIQMYNIECKSAVKSSGFGYRWAITPVYNSAQITSPAPG